MNFLRKLLIFHHIFTNFTSMLITELSTLKEDEILQLRIKDLSLELPKKYLAIIDQFNAKLKSRGIKWQPHFWLSEEWFSPDGIPGFAIPFVLGHPKLSSLEKKYLGLCEGSSQKEFFKLLCHETGHAIDNAYRLRLKKKRQKLFGLSSKKYPSSYRPNSKSTSYVKHLGDHYAQAHPDEDWAETFAVWLTNENWKKKYKNTHALKKLEYVDSVMKEISGTFQFKKSKKFKFHYKNDSRTIHEYLIQKKKTLKLGRPNFYAKHITNMFNKNPNSSSTKSALKHLKQNEKRIIRDIFKYSTTDTWIGYKCLQDIKEECKKKNYQLKYSQDTTDKKIINLIDKYQSEFIKQGRTRVYM